MKLSIQIAALRRTIKRLEEDWPLFLQRIADCTPEGRRLAIRTYELARQQDRAKLLELLSAEKSS